ncbi:MAG: DUF4783 domain-containing protein [Ignavibacteriae bacterium]|nr:DUF4783 domain-containing protein [Ignavibacteriota bacterium]
MILGFLVLLGSHANSQLDAKFPLYQHVQSNPGDLDSNSEQAKITQPTEVLTTIFSDLENGIKAGDVRIVSKYIGMKVYLNLRGAESGYYSGNHAVYLIQNFFGTRRTITFKLSTIKDTETTPYATGSGTFTTRGSREKLQVYVALGKKDDQWVITQFSVY